MHMLSNQVSTLAVPVLLWIGRDPRAFVWSRKCARFCIQRAQPVATVPGNPLHSERRDDHVHSNFV